MTATKNSVRKLIFSKKRKKFAYPFGTSSIELYDYNFKISREVGSLGK
jgi:hypothetical protein